MKKMRRRLFIFSIIFAMLSAGAAYIYLQSLDDTPEVVVESYVILIASRNIPARTEITEDMIREVNVPFESKSEFFVNKYEDIVGKYVRSEIFVDSQFHINNLMTGKDEELSVKISGNMRAVSVGITGQSGVANLIKPGDRVDIIIFLPELKENQMVVRPDITRMIMQNVEVLAIDKDLTSAEDTLIADEEVDSQKFYIATLAVPVFDVEKIILAKDIGLLDLALRPIEGDFIYDSDGAIWQEFLLDDFDYLKDMFPNYEVNSVGKVNLDPDEFKYDKYVYYTVKFGDTLREISLLFYGNEEDYVLLKEVNNISDENIISAGMGIKIPMLEDRGVFDEED